MLKNVLLNYFIDRASWYPSYDIRFLAINKPLTISYKANISQNTGIDWKDVYVKLATAKTNVSAQIPKLNTNYLQFSMAAVREPIESKLSQMQISNNNLAPGTSSNLRIRGINSDDSKNSIYVVDGEIQTDISYLDTNDIATEEILKDAAATSIYGSRGANGVIVITTKKQQDNPKLPLTITSRNATSNEFTVDAQQSIHADNKLNTLTYRETEVKATYEYQSIPKLSKNVYLIGKISD